MISAAGRSSGQPQEAASDFVTFDHARSAAEAEFGLARVREVKVALIERMFAFGAFEAPTPFNSFGQAKRILGAFARGTIDVPDHIDDAATISPAESGRRAEAVRRALPELLKLDRYERHAARLRERSLRAVDECKKKVYR